MAVNSSFGARSSGHGLHCRLAEVIEGIDGATPTSDAVSQGREDVDAGPVWGSIGQLCDHGAEPGEAAAFVRVRSTIYCELEAYYRGRLENWRLEILASYDDD
jgi:hypothetical protein